jgi:predicted RNA-binding Zn-ribbon protein involved in translation (DUF1610 family)
MVLHQFGMTAKDHTGGLQVHCEPVDLTVAKNSLGVHMQSILDGDRFATLNLSFLSRKDFGTMPRPQKINLEKVRASLDKVCPKCGALISPAEVRRIDFERIECPVCGEQFAPSTLR